MRSVNSLTGGSQRLVIVLDEFALTFPQTGHPGLGMAGGYGGLSGPALFPIAVRCVQEVAEAVRVPVVGVGGIGSACRRTGCGSGPYRSDRSAPPDQAGPAGGHVPLPPVRDVRRGLHARRDRSWRGGQHRRRDLHRRGICVDVCPPGFDALRLS